MACDAVPKSPIEESEEENLPRRSVKTDLEHAIADDEEAAASLRAFINRRMLRSEWHLDLRAGTYRFRSFSIVAHL